MGKSSSKKLRHAIYYTLYRMDPQKTHYKISFSAKMSKIKNWGTKRIYSPPHSLRRAPICPLDGPYLPLRGEFLRWGRPAKPKGLKPGKSSWSAASEADLILAETSQAGTSRTAHSA